MIVLDSMNAHFSYMEVVSHWNPQSQRFAGGDALITYLDEGWEIEPDVFYEEFGQAGGRQVVVYYFELRRGGQTVRMPVISNPYVERMVQALPVRLVSVARASHEPYSGQPLLARHA